MTHDNAPGLDHETNAREPVFNIPGVIVVLIAVFLVVHAIRLWLLGGINERLFAGLFSFTPAAYDWLLEPSADQGFVWLKALLSPVSHAFLHGGWGHLIGNALWLVVFGSPLAGRIGTLRFLLFFAVGSAGGAFAFYFAHVGSPVSVIGASGAVSALMTAAVRFGFRSGAGQRKGYTGPLLSMRQSLANRTGLSFVIVMFLINIGFAVAAATSAAGFRIAWEAHLGGFVAGWLLLPLFVPKRSAIRRS